MFKMEFRTNNAAFEERGGALEVARILRDTAIAIEHGGQHVGTVRDINGNRVGEFELTELEED